MSTSSLAPAAGALEVLFLLGSRLSAESLVARGISAELVERLLVLDGKLPDVLVAVKVAIALFLGLCDELITDLDEFTAVSGILAVHQRHQDERQLGIFELVEHLFVVQDLMGGSEGTGVKSKRLSVSSVDLTGELVATQNVGEHAVSVALPVFALVCLDVVEGRLVVLRQVVIDLFAACPLSLHGLGAL